ncbi:replication factor C subunit 1 [Camelus ferus]|nr:replication factor C subunit 1 [Camelus ferus]
MVYYGPGIDEEDDFVCKKAASKSKENGGSTNSYLGASNMKKNEEYTKTKNKPLSPIKLTPTSVLDYFGTGSVQRSDKKMVASRRKEALKDPEEREMFSSVQANLCKAVKPKYPHKASSKLATLKKREESSYKKTEPMGSKRKENAIELKETRTPKKIKSSPAKQESISPEDSEKRRSNYQAYRSYLNREGPKALGSKEIPKGAENCLEGLTFVITGVLESIERDEAKSLIERYGGKVTGNVSKKTNYLVRGRDSGQSKSDKAAALGTKIIDEDGLLNLIRTMPGKKSKYEIAAEAEMKKEKSKLERTPQKNDRGKRKISPTKKESESKKCQLTPQRESSIKSIKKDTSVFRRGLDFKEQVAEETNGDSRARNLADDSSENKVENLLWVDKYKPTSLKTIIGQQAAKVGKFAGKDDGSSFKAALLSGPPGVGKTTTASLVCQGAMMSIAFKEGLKIPPPAMNEIILGANQDIRQGPFDVARKVFAAGEETAHMSLMDKSDLFFHDYSIAPLFVQENYIHVKPVAAGGDMKKHLMLLSRAADSICDGDLVDRQIRNKQNWSLLPTQVKAAFTRAYNKEVHLTPYSLQVVKTHRLSTGPALDSEYNEELNEDDSQSDEKDQDTLETDAMIKD